MLLSVVFRLCSSDRIGSVLVGGTVVTLLVGFGRLVVVWGLLVVTLGDVFGLGFAVVVTLVGLVGFSADDGL